MSRNTDSAVTSASQLPQIRYAVLCEVASLNGGTLYACTGNAFIFSSTTYTPVGAFGGLEAVTEGNDLFARSTRLWFAAVSSAAMADVLGETLFKKPVKLYRCFLSESGTVVGTPQQYFRGFCSKVDMKLADAQRGNYFEIEVESRLKRSGNARYYSRETLWGAMGYSGDTFFDFMPQIPLFKAKWGTNDYGAGSDGGGGGAKSPRPRDMPT